MRKSWECEGEGCVGEDRKEAVSLTKTLQHTDEPLLLPSPICAARSLSKPSDPASCSAPTSQDERLVISMLNGSLIGKSMELRGAESPITVEGELKFGSSWVGLGP